MDTKSNLRSRILVALEERNKKASKKSRKSQRREPEVGTLAFSAREFVSVGLMSGEEADEWKDMMKDGYFDNF